MGIGAAAVNRDLEPSDYRPMVRELLAHQTLSRRAGSPRLALPPDVHPWAQDLAAAWAGEVKERGYDVIGDLAFPQAVADAARSLLPASIVGEEETEGGKPGRRKA